MSRVVGASDVDARQDVIRVETVTSCHLRDSLGPKGVLCVNVEHVAIETALFERQRAVHGQLVADLCLAAPELPVDFNKRLGLEATAEQVIDGLHPGREFLHFSPSFEESIA